MIASALGNALDGDGTRNNLKSAKDATGVVISKKRREVILEVLVINPRRWRQLVDDWTDRYIALVARLAWSHCSRNPSSRSARTVTGGSKEARRRSRR